MTISRLHYITQEIPGISHANLAADACEGGVRWVQLRIKNKTQADMFAIALETQAICRKWGATFIINDHVALAKEIKADGVHLGKQDMHPSEARKIVGDNFIIGGTANTFEDIQWLNAAGVDYIGLGPFRFTTTKEKLSPVLGLKGFAEIVDQCRNKGITAPIIAIGGLLPEDVHPLLQMGIHGIAVANAIANAENKKKVIGDFFEKINNGNQYSFELPTPSPSQEGNLDPTKRLKVTSNNAE